MGKTEAPYTETELRVAARNNISPAEARRSLKYLSEVLQAAYIKMLLRELAQEVRGLLHTHGPVIRRDAGNTNILCLELALARAAAILDPSTGA